MLTAVVIVSTAVPVLVLIRSATGRVWTATAAATAAVAVPWATGWLPERDDAVAYAVFVWVVLAVYAATAAPSALADALALGAIGVAAAVRLQLLVLLAALPLAVLVQELGTVPSRGVGRRLGAGLRHAVLRHRVLAGALGAGVVAWAGLAVTGSSETVLGSNANLVGEGFSSPGLRRAFLRHAGEAALALAVVPALAGVGWMLATLGRTSDRRRHALASVTLVSLLLVVLSAASVDLRFAAGTVRGPYLVFALPLLLAGLAAGLAPLHRPRWSPGSIVLAWLGMGLVLSQVTGRVVDWFVMTDELLYERLAISIGATGSPLPRIHGEVIESFNQLYPLVISRVFSVGFVPDSLHDAHVLNAFVITSTAVPAYLLARFVTGRNWLAFGVGVVAAAVPWLTLSSFLLTEVVAYPAFVWAVLAIERALASPRTANDALALLGIALAASARVQFLVLLAVLPVAVLVHELGWAQDPDLRARLATGLRRALGGHRLLVGVFAGLAVAGIALAATVGVDRVLGTYAETARNPIPPGLLRAFAQHVAQLALALAILPFLVAVGWILSTVGRMVEPRRHAFAALAGTTIVLVGLQVASFDERFGEQLVRDRYLFYLVPVLLVALAAALDAPSWPRRSLVVAAAIVCAGFATYGFPRYEKLNVDMPVAVLHDRIVELGGSTAGAQAGLVLATVVLVLLFLQAAGPAGRRATGATLAAVVALAVPAQTAYAFSRLFAVPGTSGRSLTVDESGVFNWVDRAVGTRAEVTIVPYPHLNGDYWAAVAFWWDLEFWNKAVVRAAHVGEAFKWTPSTFPKVQLTWDDAGNVSASPTAYVAQLAGDARFRVAGEVIWSERETLLVDAGRRWRLAWATDGLYEDGWTKPGTPVRLTLYPTRGADGPVRHELTVRVRPSGDGAERRLRLVSGRSEATAVATADAVALTVPVCVPAGGSGEATLIVGGFGPILGSPADGATYEQPREGGVQVVSVERGPGAVDGCGES